MPELALNRLVDSTSKALGLVRTTQRQETKTSLLLQQTARQFQRELSITNPLSSPQNKIEKKKSLTNTHNSEGFSSSQSFESPVGEGALTCSKKSSSSNGLNSIHSGHEVQSNQTLTVVAQTATMSGGYDLTRQNLLNRLNLAATCSTDEFPLVPSFDLTAINQPLNNPELESGDIDSASLFHSQKNAKKTSTKAQSDLQMKLLPSFTSKRSSQGCATKSTKQSSWKSQAQNFTTFANNVQQRQGKQKNQPASHNLASNMNINGPPTSKVFNTHSQYYATMTSLQTKKCSNSQSTQCPQTMAQETNTRRQNLVKLSPKTGKKSPKMSSACLASAVSSSLGAKQQQQALYTSSLFSKRNSKIGENTQVLGASKSPASQLQLNLLAVQKPRQHQRNQNLVACSNKLVAKSHQQPQLKTNSQKQSNFGIEEVKLQFNLQLSRQCNSVTSMTNLLPKSQRNIKQSGKQTAYSLLNASNEVRTDQQDSHSVLFESARQPMVHALSGSVNQPQPFKLQFSSRQTSLEQLGLPCRIYPQSYKERALKKSECGAQEANGVQLRIPTPQLEEIRPLSSSLPRKEAQLHQETDREIIGNYSMLTNSQPLASFFQEVQQSQSFENPIVVQPSIQSNIPFKSCGSSMVTAKANSINHLRPVPPLIKEDKVQAKFSNYNSVRRIALKPQVGHGNKSKQIKQPSICVSYPSPRNQSFEEQPSESFLQDMPSASMSKKMNNEIHPYVPKLNLSQILFHENRHSPEGKKAIPLIDFRQDESEESNSCCYTKRDDNGNTTNLTGSLWRNEPAIDTQQHAGFQLDKLSPYHTKMTTRQALRKERASMVIKNAAMSNAMSQRNTHTEKAMPNKCPGYTLPGPSSARPNYHIKECTTKPQTVSNEGASIGIDKNPLLFQTQRCYSGYQTASSFMANLKNANSSFQNVLNGGTLGQPTIRQSQESESEIEVFNIINQISSPTNDTEMECCEEYSQSLLAPNLTEQIEAPQLVPLSQASKTGSESFKTHSLIRQGNAPRISLYDVTETNQQEKADEDDIMGQFICIGAQDLTPQIKEIPQICVESASSHKSSVCQLYLQSMKQTNQNHNSLLKFFDSNTTRAQQIEPFQALKNGTFMRSPQKALTHEGQRDNFDKMPDDKSLQPAEVMVAQDGVDKNLNEQIQNCELIKTLFSPILIEKNPRQDTKKAICTGEHFQIEDDSIITSPRLQQEDPDIQCKANKVNDYIKWEVADEFQNSGERRGQFRTPFKQEDTNKADGTTQDKKQNDCLLITVLKKASKNPNKTHSAKFNKENMQFSAGCKRMKTPRKENKKCDPFSFYTPQDKQVDQASDQAGFNVVRAFPVFGGQVQNPKNLLSTVQLKDSAPTNSQSPYASLEENKFKNRTNSQTTLKDIINGRVNSMGKRNSIILSNTESFGIPADSLIRNSKPDQLVNHFEGSQIMSENNFKSAKPASKDKNQLKLSKKRKQSPLGHLLAGSRGEIFNSQRKSSVQQIKTNGESSRCNSRSSIVPQTKISLQNTFINSKLDSLDGTPKTCARSPWHQNEDSYKATVSINRVPVEKSSTKDSELKNWQRAFALSQKENSRLKDENAELRRLLNYTLQAKLGFY